MSTQSHTSLWMLFKTWLALGAQSWGGGSATLFLIQREVVERRKWMPAEEFTQAWAICQIAPGINLLGLTVLLGWRVARLPGSLVALLGLLLPSVTITALLTAFYASISGLPLVEAALRGIIPATVGLGLLMAWQMGRPLIVQSWREDQASLMVSLILLIGSGLVSFLWKPPVIFILLGAGLLGGLWGWLRARE